MLYLGIDNGVSGTVGIIGETRRESKSDVYFKMPIKKVLDYTKKEKWINRIDFVKLLLLLKNIDRTPGCRAFMERPMVNPMMFNASLSAVRALESTLVVLEELSISYEFIDSKEWQREMLPELMDKHRSDRHAQLKKMSLAIGKRLFPKIDFSGFEDADGLLIAEYCRKAKK
jgi:hypothetical protein